MSGLEASNSKHMADEEGVIRGTARSQKLLVTGGSDWHGPTMNPEFDLGDNGVTVEEFESIKTAVKKKN